MRGLSGARVEIGIVTMAYNLKHIANVLGATKLTEAFHHARYSAVSEPTIPNPRTSAKAFASLYIS